MSVPFGICSPDRQKLALDHHRVLGLKLKIRQIDSLEFSRPIDWDASMLWLQGAFESYRDRHHEQFAQNLQMSWSLGNPLAHYLVALSHKYGCNRPEDDALYLRHLVMGVDCVVQCFPFPQKIQGMLEAALALILHELGYCHKFGKAVTRDYQAANYYYELSALLGEPESALETGTFYTKGRGVGADKFRAAAYFRLAKAGGIDPVNQTWIYKNKWARQ